MCSVICITCESICIVMRDSCTLFDTLVIENEESSIHVKSYVSEEALVGMEEPLELAVIGEEWRIDGQEMHFRSSSNDVTDPNVSFIVDVCMK